MAHIVAPITVFGTAAISIPAAKVRHCKRKDCPDALFLCCENGGQQVMFGIFMSYPNKDGFI